MDYLDYHSSKFTKVAAPKTKRLWIIKLFLLPPVHCFYQQDLTRYQTNTDWSSPCVLQSFSDQTSQKQTCWENCFSSCNNKIDLVSDTDCQLIIDHLKNAEFSIWKLNFSILQYENWSITCSTCFVFNKVNSKKFVKLAFPYAPSGALTFKTSSDCVSIGEGGHLALFI